MSEIPRVAVEEARRRLHEQNALLVCAYESDEKFHRVRLEGALSLSEFQQRLPGLPKDREIIFYCA